VFDGAGTAYIGYNSGSGTANFSKCYRPANNVPSHHYASIQFGSWRWCSYGHYYYVTSTCTETNQKYFYTKIPRASVEGADVAQNGTGDIPWDKQCDTWC
jgi:hypothetical protein